MSHLWKVNGLQTHERAEIIEPPLLYKPFAGVFVIIRKSGDDGNIWGSAHPVYDSVRDSLWLQVMIMWYNWMGRGRGRRWWAGDMTPFSLYFLILREEGGRGLNCSIGIYTSTRARSDALVKCRWRGGGGGEGRLRISSQPPFKTTIHYSDNVRIIMWL